MRRALIGLTKKEDMIRASVHFMQSLTEKHNEQLKKLAEAHKAEISEIKRKQWVRIQKVRYFHLIMYMWYFSASFVNKMLFTTVAGIQHIVQYSVRNNIGNKSTNKFAEERDEYFSEY